MFDPTTFTGIHTLLSLAAIAFGVVVLIGLLANKSLPLWSGLFILTAVATSATGFGFHRAQVMPSHVVAVIALIVLAAMIAARYGFRFSGAWRWIYAATAVASLYFLTFVAIAQAFQKVAALKAEPQAVFGVVQLATLAIFIGLGVVSAKRFRPLAI